VFLLFLKLGFTAFGGPAAHIAMFHDEVVVRRKWLSEQRFIDLLGVVNLIPGPNSTEMAIHVSLEQAGWPGLILGGSAFILPAMLIVIVFAWVYVNFGSLPQAGWLLYGVKPVVIAIILQAIWSLGRKALKDWLTAAAGILALILYLLGVQPLVALISGGALVMLVQGIRRLRNPNTKTLISLPAVPGLPAAPGLSAVLSLPALAATPVSLGTLFLTFLKIGAVLYGSGYVLLAFLHDDFVARLGWLTDQQLLDAIAIGQVTPGPVFTTATFIGYILAGFPGAILATLGIFLPSFFFVAISNRLIPRLRTSPWASSLLDGVNAASIGLMVAVTWDLSKTTFTDFLTILSGILSAILLIRYKVNSTWLILGGAGIGLLVSLLR
jgi:chromate transporter